MKKLKKIKENNKQYQEYREKYHENDEFIPN